MTLPNDHPMGRCLGAVRAAATIALLIGLALSSLAGPSEGEAQWAPSKDRQPASQTGHAVPLEEPVQPPHRRVVSVNPVALVALGFISLDYEQVLTENTTLSGTGSRFRRDEIRYASVDARARYYLRGAALDGWSVGALLGLISRRDREEDTSTTGLGVGFVLEHQWLLGDDQRLAITAGGGGQRLIYFSDRPGRSVLPVVRLSLGWAF